MPEADNRLLPIERVDYYNYLGHKIILDLENQVAGTERRIAQVFGANSQMFRSKRIV